MNIRIRTSFSAMLLTFAWFSIAFGQSSEWNLHGNQTVDSTCFLGTTTNSSLQLKTNSQSRIYISESGQVGIGTQTPTKNLSVVGDAQISGLAGQGTRVVLTDSLGNLFPAYKAAGPGGNDPNFCKNTLWSGAGNSIQSDCFLGTVNDQPLVIKTNGYEKMRILSNGNVGILQPNPVARLHIGLTQPMTWSQRVNHNAIGFNCYWNGNTGPLTQIGTGPSAHINFIDNRGILHLAAFPDAGANQLVTGSLAAPGVFINESGNTGVGIAEPEALLHVNGEAIIEDTTKIESDLFVNGLSYFQETRVDGLLCAKEVRVRLTGAPCWPDYVFLPTYELAPLEEVKDFIDAEGHLPSIPSASEVDENGFEVGEMVPALLEKIEELTLYMIELDERNKALERKVKSLESNLETE